MDDYQGLALRSGATDTDLEAAQDRCRTEPSLCACGCGHWVNNPDHKVVVGGKVYAEQCYKWFRTAKYRRLRELQVTLLDARVAREETQKIVTRIVTTALRDEIRAERLMRRVIAAAQRRASALLPQGIVI